MLYLQQQQKKNVLNFLPTHENPQTSDNGIHSEVWAQGCLGYVLGPRQPWTFCDDGKDEDVCLSQHGSWGTHCQLRLSMQFPGLLMLSLLWGFMTAWFAFFLLVTILLTMFQKLDILDMWTWTILFVFPCFFLSKFLYKVAVWVTYIKHFFQQWSK